MRILYGAIYLSLYFCAVKKTKIDKDESKYIERSNCRVPKLIKNEEIEMNKQLLIIMCLSILFAFFLIAYLMVWLSGDFDDSQYVDTYRVFVSGGLVLSYNALKITEEDI